MSVWITGAGAVSCLGLGKESLIHSVLKNKSGINDLGLGPVAEQDRVNIDSALPRLTPLMQQSWPLKFSLFSAREAMNEAGWDELTDNDGLILATTTGQIPLWDRALSEYYQKVLSEEQFKKVFKHYPLGTLLDDLSLTINSVSGEGSVFKGPRTMVASACSASTQAMALACMWLETGKVERVLLGGMEVLCDLTVEGFRSLKLLANGRCKPFDVERNGINLSEGAAFFCLEKTRKSSHIKVRGYGVSSDSYHMTAPHPEGMGSALALSQMFKRANVVPQEIDWFHAHGTGSQHNDSAECAAIHTVFGKNVPFVSSTKWFHGHSLGASGLLEAVISTEALKRDVMVATQGLSVQDSAIKFSISKEHQEKPGMRFVIKNTLGFGGANACFLLEKTP